MRVGGGGGTSEFRDRGELESRSDHGYSGSHHGGGRGGGHGSYGYGHGHGHNHFGHGHSHGHGYFSGYHLGFHLGFHHGYSCGYFYGHRCGFGHLGYYYGGFGYHGGGWHFALVIGLPTYYYGRYDYHYYDWYNGRRTRLYGWNDSSYNRPSDYTFAESDACVALRVKTTDGAILEFRIDPQYYDAYDPGELYAELWAQLEEKGFLEIKELDGTVHQFPAGSISEIEAGDCTY